MNDAELQSFLDTSGVKLDRPASTMPAPGPGAGAASPAAADETGETGPESSIKTKAKPPVLTSQRSIGGETGLAASQVSAGAGAGAGAGGTGEMTATEMAELTSRTARSKSWRNLLADDDDGTGKAPVSSD